MARWFRRPQAIRRGDRAGVRLQLGFQSLEPRLALALTESPDSPSADDFSGPAAADVTAANMPQFGRDGDFSYVAYAGNVTVFGYEGKLADVVVPATVDGLAVTRIGPAFQNLSSLRSVTIPEGVTELGDGCFRDCISLTAVSIPNSVTSIGASAFEDCWELSNVVLPERLVSIGSAAFQSCTLNSLTIPERVVSIGSAAFESCPLRSLTIPAGVKSIGDLAFSWCHLTGLTIEADAITIGDGAFRGNGALREVRFTGDAPILVGVPFDQPTGFTIFRDRGTTGWEAIPATLPVFTLADAPTLAVAQAGDGRVRLAWSPPAFAGGGVSSYAVQVSRDGGEWRKVFMPLGAGPATTSMTINHLANGGSYRFRVAVVNRAGPGEFALSGPLVPTSAADTVARLAPPTEVTAVSGKSSVTLRWSPPAAAVTGFVVESSTDGGWTWSVRARPARTATSATVSGLANGVCHQFRVASINGAVRSPFSTVTPLSAATPGSVGGNERPADRNTSALRFTKDGRVAQLVRENVAIPGAAGLTTRLVYRVAGGGRDMVEDVLVVGGAAEHPAQLLLASDGTPHVLGFRAEESGNVLLHMKLEADGWRATETPFSTTSPVGNWGSRLLTIKEFEAAIAVDGTLHFVMAVPTSIFDTVGILLYGTDRGETWRFERIADQAETAGEMFVGRSRSLSLALDASGRVHVAYCPGVSLIDAPGGRYTRYYSELAYLTNRSGKWVREIVRKPHDGTGESGGSASIAIDPSGQPVIAHFEVDSVVTGSYVSARLLLERRKPTGGWTVEVVASAPDGYAAGDGARFTGFSPFVAFDRAGVPRIAFADFATRHTDGSQQHQAGQIRHAWREGGVWKVETVFRQTINDEVSLPSMSIGASAIVFTGLAWSPAAGESLVKVVRPLPDTVAPVVTRVDRPSAGTFIAGSQMSFAVTFGERVFVTGVPAVPIVVGSTTRMAVYANGSGGTALTFRYAVNAGDADADGITVGRTIAFAGGAIRDAAGNAFAGGLPEVDGRTVLVDGVAPAAVRVTPPDGGPWKAGRKLTARVTFTEPVVVTGTPAIIATVGTAQRQLRYVAGTGTQVLVFEYTVTPADVRLVGALRPIRFTLPANAVIRDRAGNALAATALPAPRA